MGLLYTTRELDVRASSAGDERVIHDVTISDETLDAHESIIRASGWDLRRFERNPVLIWQHKSASEDPGNVLGTAKVSVVGNALKADLHFVPAGTTKKADEVWSLVQAGAVRGTSVGFRPVSERWEKQDNKERLVIDAAELVELSLVTVPSNPNTLIEQVRAMKVKPTKATSDSAGDSTETTEGDAQMHIEKQLETLPATLAALLGVDDLGAAERAIAALKLSQEQLEKRAAELESKLEQIEKDVLAKQQAELEAEVDGLIGKGVISHDLRQHALVLASADIEAFRAMHKNKRASEYEKVLQTQIARQDKPQVKKQQSVGKVAMSHGDLTKKLMGQGMSLEDATVEAARQLMEE
jgi:HK97 family phage prohead protease